MEKSRVGIIFGSRSVEHEVSVITAYQVIKAIDKEKYEPIPIYIKKDGEWVTAPESFGEFKNNYPNIKVKKIFISSNSLAKEGLFGTKIKIDIAFPLVHGTFGEDGTLQGMLEMINVPYVGSGVTGSAISMDKIVSKRLFSGLSLPIVDWLCFSRNNWREKSNEIIKEIQNRISFPLFVKPSSLGSSIGINKCETLDELSFALDVAFEYDYNVIVEKALSNVNEVNCAVLDSDDIITSLCEMPIVSDEFLTYGDKYKKGGKGKGMKGASRIIPAPISKEVTKKIQDMAVYAFRSCQCSGVARVDFFVTDDEKVYINEINTIPGSLSFFLFEPIGISFKELITRLIDIGFERAKKRKEIRYSVSYSIF
ncbi:TPA: D-alanine--D-alanine ligase [bacterium]|nr:D-alanine--D-alanine ligase [bacterium]